MAACGHISSRLCGRVAARLFAFRGAQACSDSVARSWPDLRVTADFSSSWETSVRERSSDTAPKCTVRRVAISFPPSWDRLSPCQLFRLWIPFTKKANCVLFQGYFSTRVHSHRRSRGLIRKRTLGCLPLITIRETSPRGSLQGAPRHTRPAVPPLSLLMRFAAPAVGV